MAARFALYEAEFDKLKAAGRVYAGPGCRIWEDRMAYEDVYRRSIEQPEAFWGEEAKAIHWHVPPQQVLDYSTPPFRRWFVGGQTNLCYNAVDRHVAERGDQLALVAVSTETDVTRELTYRNTLPNVQASYDLTPRLRLRAAWSTCAWAATISSTA